jgi:hypothetical protein
VKFAVVEKSRTDTKIDFRLTMTITAKAGPLVTQTTSDSIVGSVECGKDKVLFYRPDAEYNKWEPMEYTPNTKLDWFDKLMQMDSGLKAQPPKK